MNNNVFTPILMVSVFAVFILSARWFSIRLQLLIRLLLGSDEDDDTTTYLVYSALMLVGTFMHEASHWMTALLLGTGVGAFSLLPEQRTDGTIRLGYAQVGRTDVIRSSIIGAAPLMTGIGLVYVIGDKMGVFSLWELLTTRQISSMMVAAQSYTNDPYFWVGIYLIFQISSGMLPSKSDRKDWIPAIIVITIIVGAVYYVMSNAGITTTIVSKALPVINKIVSSVLAALLLSTVAHLLVTIILMLVTLLVQKAKNAVTTVTKRTAI